MPFAGRRRQIGRPNQACGWGRHRGGHQPLLVATHGRAWPSAAAAAGRAGAAGVGSSPPP